MFMYRSGIGVCSCIGVALRAVHVGVHWGVLCMSGNRCVSVTITAHSFVSIA